MELGRIEIMRARLLLVMGKLIDGERIPNQKALALSLGRWSYQTIFCEIKNGRRNVPLTLLIEFADYHRVNPSFIMGYSEEMFLPNPVELPDRSTEKIREYRLLNHKSLSDAKN